MTVLRPLRDNAIGIRKRFFTTFCRARRSGGTANRSVIDASNKIAYPGDVMADVYLLANGYMTFFQAFRVLYGMDLSVAETLIEFQHMVDVMNNRATLVAKLNGAWKKEREYQELATWTRGATPQDMEMFNADPAGHTRGKRLYLNLPHNK